MTAHRKPRPGEGRGSQISRDGDTPTLAESADFVCAACGYVYQSPISIAWAAHPCPARGGAPRTLKPQPPGKGDGAEE